jgi:hypothetical protein
MKKYFVIIVFMVSIGIAENSVAFNSFDELNQSIAQMDTRVKCERYDFNENEMQACVQIWKSCQRPELRPSERDLCVVETVRTGKSR